MPLVLDTLLSETQSSFSSIPPHPAHSLRSISLPCSHIINLGDLPSPVLLLSSSPLVQPQSCCRDALSVCLLSVRYFNFLHRDVFASFSICNLDISYRPVADPTDNPGQSTHGEIGHRKREKCGITSVTVTRGGNGDLHRAPFLQPRLLLHYEPSTSTGPRGSV